MGKNAFSKMANAKKAYDRQWVTPVGYQWHLYQVSGTGATNNRISGTGGKIVALVPIFEPVPGPVHSNLNTFPLIYFVTSIFHKYDILERKTRFAGHF